MGNHRRGDETNPVGRCPVQLAALHYSWLALSSSVVLALLLEDNFTSHPLSSEILLKVPARYYQRESSVNAQMLYPLLLPSCRRWVLKRGDIKREAHAGTAQPRPAASAACGAQPCPCTASAFPGQKSLWGQEEAVSCVNDWLNAFVFNPLFVFLRGSCRTRS